MKSVGWLMGGGLFLYILIAAFFYFSQETFLFHPRPLPQSYIFDYAPPFEEKFIQVGKHDSLHGILFKADSSRGLVYYLHGNAGALDTWGSAAQIYLKNGWDVFIIDYRGYGKSTGSIQNQETLLRDVLIAYDSAMKRKAEYPIIIHGYSIGTGPAAYVASQRTVDLLILQAPYASIERLAREKYPVLPGFLVKYPLRTHQYLKNVEERKVIFHGSEDTLIPLAHAQTLASRFAEKDTLITIPGLGHGGFDQNARYLNEISRLLNALE